MIRRIAILAAFPVFLLACGDSAVGPKTPATAESKWAEKDKELFDDGIDFSAVPMEPPAELPDLNEMTVGRRAFASDGVMVVKCTSVTEESNGGASRIRIEVTKEGEPLLGKAPPENPLVLKIDARSDLYGTAHAEPGKLMGHKWVISFKRYAGEDGEVVVHFHLSANHAAVKKAISDAALKREFYGH